MVITGVCRIELRIYECNSLKEKRHIIKSIIERAKNRFNISIAETGLNDMWQLCEIGYATVSNDRVLIENTINKVTEFIENDGRAEITSINIEIY